MQPIIQYLLKISSLKWTKWSFLILFCSTYLISTGQCDETRKACAKELSPYVSDGQFRGGVLSAGETKLYRSTFYGDRSYKLIVGAGGETGNLRFKILSTSYKVLFDSAQHDYPASWKLKFRNTSDFLVQVSLKEGVPEGCSVLMIGFEI